MKYLIVTADDLGLTRSINEGIARSISEGIVRSVSVIPTGEALEDAVKVIRDLKLSEIGAHLALTETRPILNSSHFYKSHNDFFFNFISGRIVLDDIYKELKSQLDVLRKMNIKITHINSHEHIHLMPKIMDIFIRLAKECDIPVLRYPRQDRKAKPGSLSDMYKKFILSYFAGQTKKAVYDSGLLVTDFFLGLLDAGRLNESALLENLRNLKNGVTELVTHPGFLSPEVLSDYSWHIRAEEELAALTSKRVIKAVSDNGIKLITFSEFLLFGPEAQTF